MTDKSSQPEADFTKVKRFSIHRRKSKAHLEGFSKTKPIKSLNGFIDAIPNILQGKNFREFAKAMAKARKNKRMLHWMIGGHFIKVGLAPLLIQLMREGWITSLTMNSAASIHDSEIARFGHTSEEVETAIKDGSFGMAKETSAEYLEALNSRIDSNMGWGEALSDWVTSERFPHNDMSLLAACRKYKVTLTVFGALGTDIIWQHPELDGAVLGKLGERDFKKLVAAFAKLQQGVVLNWGSAVIIPEVFLKAFTTARNLGAKNDKITAANFDQIQHYRPTVNILKRPTNLGGKHYAFTGHHEFNLPLLAAMLSQTSS